MSSDSEFNPVTQALNYTSAYGEMQISFADIQTYFESTMEVSIIYGCRIGCAGLMSIMLWLISKNRMTPIHILNQLSLIFLVIHSALYLCYVFGPYNSVAAYFTGYDLSDSNAKAISVATDLFYVFLIMCIEASLVFQVKIIFRSPEVYRLGLVLTAISAATAFATVGAYLYALVRSILLLYKDEALGSLATNLPILLFAVSTIFICFILMVKLGLAIRSRRYLGLKQFGTLHILLIMCTQTMIIPAVLVILSFGYITTIYSRLTPIAIMLVTLQLPLSSMWASSANNSSEPTSTQGPYFSRSSSHTQPTIITTNGSSTLHPVSPGTPSDIEKLDYRNEEFVMYPLRKDGGIGCETLEKERSNDSLDGFHFDTEEDRQVWEEANRLTQSYYDEQQSAESAQVISSTVHTYNNI